MAENDVPTEPDPDDWFSEPDVTEAFRERPAAASTEPAEVDDWLDATAAAPARRRRAGRGSSTSPTTAIVIGAVLVVLLLIGLAVGGVFSSGTPKATPPLFTITHPPTTATTPKTPAGAGAPTKTLKPGDTGPQVRLLQRSLAHLGFSPGTIDGQYGPSTTAAVTSFQKAHGLTADGVCGPKTIAALQNALTTG